MKRFILYFLISTISILGFSQELQKTIKLDAVTLKRGGSYVLIPSTPGKVVVLKEFILKYTPKSIVYTINSSDSIKIITDSPNSEYSYLFVISDSVFVNTTPFISYNPGWGDYNYGNSIRVTIPTGKLTLGTGDLYLTLKYELY
jgi:hypothetical protein